MGLNIFIENSTTSVGILFQCSYKLVNDVLEHLWIYFYHNILAFFFLHFLFTRPNWDAFHWIRSVSVNPLKQSSTLLLIGLQRFTNPAYDIMKYYLLFLFMDCWLKMSKIWLFRRTVLEHLTENLFYQSCSWEVDLKTDIVIDLYWSISWRSNSLNYTEVWVLVIFIFFKHKCIMIVPESCRETEVSKWLVISKSSLADSDNKTFPLGTRVFKMFDYEYSI